MPIDPKILESILLAALDPDPIDFSRVNEAEVRRAKAAIRRATGPNGAAFNRPLTRNHFLCACLDTTEMLPEEHLIMAYGYRQGNGALIDRLHHAVGVERSVAIPTHVQQEIQRHYLHRSNAEVLVFHNHPRTGDEPELFYAVKSLLRDRPIPSGADRRQLQRYAFNLVGLVRKMANQGQVRFYLGESGLVREFRLPLLSPLLTDLNRSNNSEEDLGVFA